MVKDYILLILIAFLWGIWGLGGKIAVKYYGNYWTTFIINVISAPLAIFILGPYLWMKKISFSYNAKGMWALIGATIAAILGGLIYYRLLNRLPVSLVVAASSIYPLFTVLLAYIFLGEVLLWYQYIGIFLIVGGVILLGL
jgi:transporter family protein